VGVPLVLALGILRGKATRCPKQIHSIGILETAAIGDTTLLSAVLLDLREAYPDARIVLFAGDSNFAVARILAGPDEVVRLPIKDVLTARRLVRSQHFDVFIDFGPWARLNAILTSLASANFRIGFRTPGQFRHYAYDCSVVHSDNQHELENLRDILRAIDVKPVHAAGFPDAVGRCNIPAQYRPNSDYVVFHLWSGGSQSRAKEWPTERWVELGKALSEAGLSIALTGAPWQRGMNEQVIAEAKAAGAGEWTNAAGTNIEQTIGLLRGSRLTVSVNTGVMHLAAVAGVPVVGLSGPVSDVRWAPLGPCATAVSAKGPGCGYISLGFEFRRDCDCMRRITVNEVLHQCRNLLRPATEQTLTAAG
jgi:heptosyltransferase I